MVRIIVCNSVEAEKYWKVLEGTDNGICYIIKENGMIYRVFTTVTDYKEFLFARCF